MAGEVSEGRVARPRRSLPALRYQHDLAGVERPFLTINRDVSLAVDADDEDIDLAVDMGLDRGARREHDKIRIEIVALGGPRQPPLIGIASDGNQIGGFDMGLGFLSHASVLSGTALLIRR
jgi:hypothetical protein